MCGRYYIDEEMASELDKLVLDLDRKIKGMVGDVKPTMNAPVIYNQDNHKKMGIFQWGFSNNKGLIINAKAETAADKAIFREPLLHRRCIIPARGFYEWDSDKNKFEFTNKQKSIMYMAGIFRYEKENSKFVILTTEANLSMKSVHDRMPVILGQNMLNPWLFDNSSTGDILRAVPQELNKYSEMEQMRLEF